VTSLYVTNLPLSTTEELLALHFAAFGTVLSVKLKRDEHSGLSVGRGFVEMRTTAEARSAERGLNATRFEGRLVSVNRATRS
jgi:RNA recognition motif-containing protein